MIAPLLLISAQAIPARPPIPTPVPAPARAPAVVLAPLPAGVPADWLALPELRFRRRPDLSAGYSDYVRGEVLAGRCPAVRNAAGGMRVAVDFAVQISMAGAAQRIVPRAIGCPAVEQYATGLVERMLRNLDPPTLSGDAWFHTALEFAWPA
jgi:hypothetical protein